MGVVRRQTFTRWHAANWVVQFAFDAAVVHFLGWGPIRYFLLSAYLAGSLHPCASHFIAEHYVFVEGYETYSYYGWLNKLCFNVGFHNEHRGCGRASRSCARSRPSFTTRSPSTTPGCACCTSSSRTSATAPSAALSAPRVKPTRSRSRNSGEKQSCNRSTRHYWGADGAQNQFSITFRVPLA